MECHINLTRSETIKQTVMITKTQLDYKAETGNSPFIEVEAELLTGALEGLDFEGWSGKEIIDALNYDFNKNAKYGVYTDQLPPDYIDTSAICIRVYSPEYVKWLENLK